MISWPFIILFGDSITQFALETNGWGATIANKLVRKCDVLNRGLSGYNTRWAKLILPELISKNSEHAAAVTIFFGANDSSLKEENPQQHVPLEEYIENLRSMIQYLKTVGITEDKIILITPPPLHEPSWEKQCYIKGYNLNRLNSATGAYAKACVQVGSESGTDVVDLWTLMQEGGQDYREYLSDGLHLSDQGNQFLESNLWPLLEKKLGALPFLLPYWNDVDNNNPESSLLSITAKAEAYLATDPATAQTLIQDAALTVYITFPSIGYGEDDVDGGLTDLYQLLGVGWKETKDVISWWEV